ncbi:hypothetical protein Tco_0795777 [Tanacetum coccineum]
MLDRTDFESWQQRIRLYCLGKDNGENIMKSIKEGPFHMGTVSDVITRGTEGAVQQGPVRARVLNDLSAEEKEREQVTNVDDDVDDSPENDLALNVDHVFEADECDAFDSDVDEGPITQTMFMTNLTSEDRIYDEAGTSL